MNFEEIRNKADRYLNHAQGLIMTKGCMNPVMFSIMGDSVKPVVVNMEDEDSKKIIEDLMKILSNTCEALIFIFDAYILPLEKGEDAPENISQHPDRGSTISCFIYTKDRTELHKLDYIHEDSRYTFHDGGWESIEVEKSSYFSNPYIS